MRRQPVALIGCGLLALGVFAPIVTMPLAGTASYLDAGTGKYAIPVGQITLGIAGVALLATLARYYALLWFAGLASLVLELWAYSRVHDMIADKTLGLSWGWPVLAAGGVALLIAAGMQSKDDPDKLPRWLVGSPAEPGEP